MRLASSASCGPSCPLAAPCPDQWRVPQGAERAAARRGDVEIGRRPSAPCGRPGKLPAFCPERSGVPLEPPRLLVALFPGLQPIYALFASTVRADDGFGRDSFRRSGCRDLRCGRLMHPFALFRGFHKARKGSLRAGSHFRQRVADEDGPLSPERRGNQRRRLAHGEGVLNLEGSGFPNFSGWRGGIRSQRRWPALSLTV